VREADAEWSHNNGPIQSDQHAVCISRHAEG